MNHAEYFADSFNRHVKWYEESITPLTIYNESYDALIKRMRPNAEILDVACGPANVSAYLKKQLPAIHITGIDLAREMITKAKQNIPDGSFHVMDIRYVSQLNKLFDVIVLGFCIPYLNDEETIELLKDCRKLIHSDGTVYLSYIETELTTPFNANEPVMRRHNSVSISKYVEESGLHTLQRFTASYDNGSKNEDIHVALLLAPASK